jgi:hypothetical protein
MYMGQVMVGRLKYIQQSHLCQSLLLHKFAIGKLKRYKLPGCDQIPAELIGAGGETLHSGIHKLIKLIWSKENLKIRAFWNIALSP